MSEGDAITQEPKMKKRHAVAAFFIALGAPGLGQLYNDQPRKGLFFFTAYIVGAGLCLTPIILHPSFLILAVASASCGIYSIIDAVWTTRRIRVAAVHPYQRWYSILAVAVIWQILCWGGLPTFKRSLPIEALRIPTGSMQPTLTYGDCIIADKCYYPVHPIKPGDLAVFHYPTDTVNKYLSRCLAVAGDTVVIRNRVPYVNGKAVPSPGYSLGVWWPIAPKDSAQPGIYPPGAGNADNYGPIVVPRGKCFMLSDNISNALDSRFKGFVDPKELISKPLYIYWSTHLNRIGRVLR